MRLLKFISVCEILYSLEQTESIFSFHATWNLRSELREYCSKSIEFRFFTLRFRKQRHLGQAEPVTNPTLSPKNIRLSPAIVVILTTMDFAGVGGGAVDAGGFDFMSWYVSVDGSGYRVIHDHTNPI